LFPQFTTLGVHALSETLQSSETFTCNGQQLNFKNIVPHGITFASFFSTTALETRLTDYSASHAAAGTVIAVGGKPSAVGPRTE
jgi:hypothetical protein